VGPDIEQQAASVSGSLLFYRPIKSILKRHLHPQLTGVNDPRAVARESGFSAAGAVPTQAASGAEE